MMAAARSRPARRQAMPRVPRPALPCIGSAGRPSPDGRLLQAACAEAAVFYYR
jgi:hypothetical protein